MNLMAGTLSGEQCAQVIERILSGEQDAYAEIVRAYQDPLRAAVGGFARSAGELEDFCHRAFVEVYFKLSDYDPERGPFLPWFLTVSRNSILEDLRRRKSEERRLHRYVERAAQEGTPFEGQDQAQAALERCLTEFEPGEANVIRARYREGRSCDQIAASLGKTGVATRKLLQRLRERLRACVERRLAAFQET